VIRHAGKTDKPDSPGKIKGQNYFEGMLHVVVEIIKEGIAKPSADDQTDHCPDQEILNIFSRIFIIFMLYPVKGEKINDDASDQIHQTVIAQLKRADTEKMRTYMRRQMLPCGY
jgi:hypothetical protein